MTRQVFDRWHNVLFYKCQYHLAAFCRPEEDKRKEEAWQGIRKKLSPLNINRVFSASEAVFNFLFISLRYYLWLEFEGVKMAVFSDDKLCDIAEIYRRF